MMNTAARQFWFALRVWPGRAASVCRELARRGFEIFRPLTRIRVKRRRGRTWTTIWTVRGYFADWIFARCTLHQVFGIERDIQAISEAARIGDMPAPVPDTVIGLLMASADRHGVMRVSDETLRKRFGANAPVSFASGPLAGAAATVLADKGGSNVRVLVEILGGRREMNAPAETLREIAA